MEHKARTRALSWLLSLALLLSLIPGMSLTAQAADEDITSNITIIVSDSCEDMNRTVSNRTKNEYTVKEGVVVTFQCSKWWNDTATIYLNGTAVATWAGSDYRSTYVWTAKKNAKLNWASYGQRSANIYLTETSHDHSFTYTGSGDTITATCGAEGCDLPEVDSKHVATLTIAAPLHTAVGDGKSAEAQIEDANKIQGTATVSYYDADASGNRTGNELQSAPTNGGKYWAEITLGAENNAATAHVVYEITNPDYDITLPTGLVGGTVEAEPTTAKFDAQVTLTATPDNGFTLTALTVKDGENNDVAVSGSDNTRTFTMPASNVTVSATFEGEPFDVTIADGITGGTVAVASTLENGKAKAGSEVTLTVTPATGFEVRTVKYNDTTITASNGVYTFIMPQKPVTVTATFVGKPVTVTLNPTGDGGTASLLHDDYTAVTNEEPLTKKAGEKFILLVNRDDGYEFNVQDGANNAVSMAEFTKQEYEAYVAYAKANNINVPTNAVLVWVTTPGVAENSVSLTVNFSKLNTFTILYQPSDSSTTAVWCKFAVNSGVDGNNTDSAQMKSDATMGDGSKVYSLKVTAGFTPNQIAFVTNESALNDATMISGVTESQNTNSWHDIDGGKYLVIGGDAKTVIVAFVANENAMKAYKDNAVDTAKTTGGVEYRVAVVTGGNAGTVKAPANTFTKVGYDFAGWRGFEGTAPNKTEKIYNAGDSISVSENTTLNAVWNLKNSTVTLNLNGGTGNSSVDPVTYGTKLPTLENPTRSGFAFDGWTASETVTEDGTLFAKGSLFDLNTKITADLGLTAQWKHVHSYSCYQISAFGSRLAKYQKYEKALHIAVCGCNDIQLTAHEFDSSGKCACGYQKPGADPVTLNISYGQWSNNSYTEKMKGMPESAKPGEEVSVCAPPTWGNLEFSKWQYSAGDNVWVDLTACNYAAFIIPATMYVRALYINPVQVPQVELSARQYDDQTEVDSKTWTMDNILFQMNYKLPDGYTFVDAGIRLGDNAGISYYELKERTITTDAGGKAMLIGAAAVTSFLSGGINTVDLSATDTYYEEHTRSVLTELSAATLAKYMYESKPINVEKYDPIYWEAKAVTKGMSGSMATLPPLRFAQKDGGNHWIYGIGWLRYKKPNGTIETIYTDALAATVKNIPGSAVTKSGS